MMANAGKSTSKYSKKGRNNKHEKRGKLLAWIMVLLCAIVIILSLMVILCIVWKKRRSKYMNVAGASDVEGFEMNGDKATLKEMSIDGVVALQTVRLMADDTATDETDATDENV